MTISFKQIKAQLPQGAQIQVGNGKEAEFFTAENFHAYCFRKKKWKFEPEEVRIYRKGKGTVEFAPSAEEEEEADTDIEDTNV